MYTRTIDSPLFCPLAISSHTSAGGSSSLPNLGSFVTERNTRTGTRVPGYRGIIKGGGSATSDYYLDATRLSNQSMSGYTTFVTGSAPDEISDTHNISGFLNLIDTIDHISLDNTGLEAKALSQVYDRIRSQQTMFNSLNFLGELRETIHMLRRPMSALRDNLLHVVNTERKTVSAIRKLRSQVKRRDAFAKMVSGTALEINFGWAPLISDVRDISKTIAAQSFRRPRADRVTGTAQVAETQVTVDNSSPAGIYGGYQFFYHDELRHTTESSIRYIVGLQPTATVASSALGRVIDDFGFTAGNILPTAYELTPWSWLADYFTNLGDIIEAGATGVGNVTFVSRVQRQKTTLTRYKSPLDPTPYVLANRFARVQGWSFSASKSEGIRTTMQRSNVALGLPPVVFKNPFSSAPKVTNMLSVMEQQRRSVRF